MYHPAAALHQASLRETLFADIGGLPAALLAAREALEAERAGSVQARNGQATAVEPAVVADEPDNTEQLTLF
jgi:hypothetical protein